LRVLPGLVGVSILLMSQSPAWGDEVSSLGLPDFSAGYSVPRAGELEELPEPVRNQLLALRMMLDAGFDYDEFDDLTELWNRESDWLTGAANPNSSARGIPQAMTSLHEGTDTEEWLTSAERQIEWGLDYIRRRYGSPSKALAKWLERERLEGEGWY